MALAIKLKCRAVTGYFRVTVAHGGKTIRLIVARIFVVADADKRRFQKTHHSCEYFFARETFQF